MKFIGGEFKYDSDIGVVEKEGLMSLFFCDSLSVLLLPNLPHPDTEQKQNKIVIPQTAGYT